MRTDNSIKLPCSGMYMSAAVKNIFLYCSLYVLCGLAAILLVFFFPAWEHNLFLVYLPIFLLLLLQMVFSIYTIHLTKDTVTLLWFGLPLRKISADALQLFCLAGNAYEDMLCFTTRSVEEMAILEEKHLLRNPFTKYEVARLKKRSDWQEVLVGKYLNRLRSSPWGIFRDRQVLFADMNPVAQHRIRKLHPQLPYRNCTNIRSYPPFRFSETIPMLSLLDPDCYEEIREHAIVLRTKKKVVRTLQKEDIRTVVRVDIFQKYDKYIRHHTPLLFLTTRTAEEIAGDRSQDLSKEELLLLVYQYAEKECRGWFQREDCCILCCTEENVARLQDWNVQWIDISEGWLKNRL